MNASHSFVTYTTKVILYDENKSFKNVFWNIMKTTMRRLIEICIHKIFFVLINDEVCPRYIRRGNSGGRQTGRGQGGYKTDKLMCVLIDEDHQMKKCLRDIYWLQIIIVSCIYGIYNAITKGWHDVPLNRIRHRHGMLFVRNRT